MALLSTTTEADAMNESDTFSSYTVVEPINDDTPLPALNSLLGILKRMRGCEGADGHPWSKTDVSPGSRVSLPRSERAMEGGADGAGTAARGRPLPGGNGAGAAFG